MEISPKKLITGLILIFLLGVMFAIVNGVYTDTTDSSLPIIVYAISFVSIIIGGVIVLLFSWKINKAQLERAVKILPENERKIIKLLMENNNSLEQNKLVALTGINKVKMSRVLTELEIRKVVKRMNLGNTKMVVLDV